MKHIIILVIFSFMFHVASAQQTQKTLIKSFNLKGNDFVMLNFDGKVEIKEWNNDVLRVQMGIELQNTNMRITSPHASCLLFPIFESRHESIAENRYR